MLTMLHDNESVVLHVKGVREGALKQLLVADQNAVTVDPPLPRQFRIEDLYNCDVAFEGQLPSELAL